MMPLPRFAPGPRAALAGLPGLAALVLAACSATPPAQAPIEAFDATDRFSRTVTVSPEEACQAARLALLSQGYLVTSLQKDELRGRKNFQPKGDSHAEVEVHVVCALTGEGPGTGTVFVSALQEHFELKKASNSASVGLGVVGSLSVPFSLSNDSMVKVASATITAPRFYDRFFEVMERYLPGTLGMPSDEMTGPREVPSEF